jgi:hypothetical protein
MESSPKKKKIDTKNVELAMELKVCSDLKLELKVRPKLGIRLTAGNHGSLVNRL